MMGKNQIGSHFNFREEWTDHNKNGTIFIQNNITQEQFTFKTVIKHDQILTRRYLERSMYPIPKSPKIIIIDETNSHLHLLVQSPLAHIKFLIRKQTLLIDVLQIVKQISVIAHHLKQKYGPFEITQEMISVQKQDEIMLWINEEYHKNQRQLPLDEVKDQEDMMIKQIINICQKYSKFDLSHQLLPHRHFYSSFIKFIKNLTVKIEVQKFKITQKIYRQRTNVKQSMLPIRLQHNVISKQNNKKICQKISPTQANYGNKKRKFDSHRRTYTISQNQQTNYYRKSTQNLQKYENTPIIKSIRSQQIFTTNFVQKQIKNKTKMVGNHLFFDNPLSKNQKPISNKFDERIFEKRKKETAYTQNYIKQQKEQNIVTGSSSNNIQDDPQRRTSTIPWIEEQKSSFSNSLEHDFALLLERQVIQNIQAFKLKQNSKILIQDDN